MGAVLALRNVPEAGLACVQPLPLEDCQRPFDFAIDPRTLSPGPAFVVTIEIGYAGGERRTRCDLKEKSGYLADI